MHQILAIFLTIPLTAAVRKTSTPSQETCVAATFPSEPMLPFHLGWPISNKTSEQKTSTATTSRIIFITRPPRFNNPRIRLKRKAEVEDKPVSRNIIAGEPADQKEWPFLVTILRKGRTFELEGVSWDIACGGTLIHPRFVLAAAHCFIRKTMFGWYYLKKDQYGVRIGAYSLLANNVSTAVFAKIDEYDPYPLFDLSTVSNGGDLAVIKLDRDILFNDYAQPACLPNIPITQFPRNTPCKSAGRGVVTRDGSTISSYPRQTTLWIADNKTCFDSLKVPRLAQDGRVFCAGDPQGLTDTCQGDSGGPLMCRHAATDTWQLSGIVSFGLSGCGVQRIPGGYTAVDYYLPWINKTMERLLILPESRPPESNEIAPEQPLILGRLPGYTNSSSSEVDVAVGNFLLSLIRDERVRNRDTLPPPEGNGRFSIIMAGRGSEDSVNFELP